MGKPTTKRIEMVGTLGSGKSFLLSKFDDPRIHKVFENLSLLEKSRVYYNESPASRNLFLQAAYYVETQKLIDCQAATNGIMVCDFSFEFHHFGYSQALFELGKLSGEELNLLEQIMQIFNSRLIQVAGVIHCHVSEEVNIERILDRCRGTEMLLDINFLRTLRKLTYAYTDAMQVPKITINLENDLSDNHQILSDFLGRCTRHK